MYAIMGATGNTGSVVANTLLAKGQKVRVIGRNAERLKALTARGAEAFVADAGDSTALATAFSAAKGVYVLIPPDMQTQDAKAYEERIAESIANALERSRVEHAVLLSSIGADKSDKTGPVVGLHNFEQRVDRISNLNVLQIRAGYFMENTLAQVEIIKARGITAGAERPDLKLPLIATRDIGAFVADALVKLDFHGKELRELLGQRDLSMTEITSIIGNAIGNPNLKYTQLADEQLRPAMIQAGMSENVAKLLLEMMASLNSGHMKALEQRSARNTTPTSYETFVAEELVPLYTSRLVAA